MTVPQPDCDTELIAAYAQPAPRYTSYPTAPHFHDGIGADDYVWWLEELDPTSELSLYVHVPYCDTLCWFCGCHTKITRRYDPVAAYLPVLEREVSLVHERLPAGARVTSLHWGGGSPALLTPSDIKRLAFHIQDYFDVDRDAEFAIEIDPRGLDQPRVQALAEVGVTRASIGVQDFNPTVQAAINRRQSFEETQQAVRWLRDAGIENINIDAMYGLPHQTCQAVSCTIGKVCALDPNRIALFGYAHVPWLKRHQSMIDDAALPGAVERYGQSSHAASLLQGAGYIQIGLDHFAKPTDSLARAADAGALRRNFQGYTSDSANALIGIGASAISCLPQGYCQNETPISRYRSRIEGGGLATAKGIRPGAEDIVRRWVIEQIMCDLSFSASALRARYGSKVGGILQDAANMQRFARDGLIKNTDDGFRVTERGRPFMRVICAHFDGYLKRRQANHSGAI